MGILKTLHLKPSKKSSRTQVGNSINPVVDIDIVSDTVCPFCYLLYSRLHIAMREFEGQLDFRVHWIAYQLQPFAPPEGMRKQDYLEMKFKDQAQFILAQKQKFFKNEGLNLSLDGFVGNTFNSHRLVAYANNQSLEKADEVMGRLLHASHAEGQHINDAQVLREIGRAAKLEDPDRVADDPECCAAEVNHQLETMYKDVIGIPHMVLKYGSEKVRIGGAKDITFLRELFQKIHQDLLLEAQTEASESKKPNGAKVERMQSSNSTSA